MARPVLGISVQREVRQNYPETGRKLPDDRLPLAMREA
jgi:hypothetical protein